MAEGSLAGTARQNYVPGGPVTVGFTPDPDAADQIAALTEQLETQLRQYRASIAEQVKPWSDEWAEAQSWGAKVALLQDARDRGLRRGASAWGEDQVGFLEQVGGWASDAGSWVVEQGEDLVDWYSDLPMLGKVFPGIYAAGEGIDAAGEALEDASEEIQRLWAQREALFEFFKALYEQSVNAVQITIETLAAMGGELGELMQAMWDQGAEWVQGLIEMCRESEILQKIFASVGALFSALPPNLWAEGISTAAGYIVPELLVSVVLAVLAAITAGASSTILAARLLSYGARLKRDLSKLGALSRVLLSIYDGVKALGQKIANLVRALWRNISETLGGTVNSQNVIVRNSAFHATSKNTIAQSVIDGIDPKFLNPNSRFGAAFYVAEEPGTALAEMAHHGVATSHGIRFEVNSSAVKMLDLTDPRIANEWGYRGGPISSATKSIGDNARSAGYNAIRFSSERAPGSNLAILDDFNEILKPRMISPTD